MALREVNINIAEPRSMCTSYPVPANKRVRQAASLPRGSSPQPLLPLDLSSHSASAAAGSLATKLEEHGDLLGIILAVLVGDGVKVEPATMAVALVSRSWHLHFNSRVVWFSAPRFLLPSGAVNATNLRVRGVAARGTEGVCFNCVERSSGRVFAVKRPRSSEGNGLHYFIVRSLAALRAVDHPNVAGAVDASLGGGRLHTFFDFSPLALSALLDRRPRRGLGAGVARELLRQLLSGLDHLHQQGILHRNLKPKHCLLYRAPAAGAAAGAAAEAAAGATAGAAAGAATRAALLRAEAAEDDEARFLVEVLSGGAGAVGGAGGAGKNCGPGRVPLDAPWDTQWGGGGVCPVALRISDFAMSRLGAEPFARAGTPQCVTLWYRAPEVLLGLAEYSPAVDTWSAGCIFAELALGRPLFAGASEIDQLFQIFHATGTPTPADWPAFHALPLYAGQFPRFAPPPPSQGGGYGGGERGGGVGGGGLGGPYGASLLAALGPCGCDLLGRLLACNPERRISAAQALRHPFLAPEPATNAGHPLATAAAAAAPARSVRGVAAVSSGPTAAPTGGPARALRALAARSARRAPSLPGWPCDWPAAHQPADDAPPRPAAARARTGPPRRSPASEADGGGRNGYFDFILEGAQPNRVSQSFNAAHAVCTHGFPPPLSFFRLVLLGAAWSCLLLISGGRLRAVGAHGLPRGYVLPPLRRRQGGRHGTSGGCAKGGGVDGGNGVASFGW